MQWHYSLLLSVTGFLLVLLQIYIAEKLVKTAKIEQQSIVILSPYNAQVSEIRDELKKRKMDEITVTTITKSQGDSAPLGYLTTNPFVKLRLQHHKGKILTVKLLILKNCSLLKYSINM